MLKGVVISNIVSTRKQDSLVGSKFLEVRLIENGQNTDKYIIAVDSVGAGIGERVLVVSGSTARSVFGNRSCGKGDSVPADMAIVGIIDSLEVDREKK